MCLSSTPLSTGVTEARFALSGKALESIAVLIISVVGSKNHESDFPTPNLLPRFNYLFYRIKEP